MTGRTWKIIVSAAIAVIVVLAAAVAWHISREPDPAAMALVREAAAALDSVAVRGEVVTRVRTPRGLVESRAIVHRGDGRVVIEYLSGPAEGIEVYRQQGVVWAKGPRGVHRRADVGERSMRRELLERNWRFRMAGERSMAGRAVRVVKGTGPGGGLTVAVDTETSFPLGMRRTDPGGKLISSTIWQSADFTVEPPPRRDPPAPEECGPVCPRREATTLAELRGKVDWALLRATWLPDGFNDERWFLHETHIGRVVELRYSDGLRALIIIQRPRVKRPAAQTAPDGQRRSEQRDGVEPPGSGTWRERVQDRRAERVDRRVMRGPMHRMRGVGGDAVRRAVDGTIAIVIGPLPAEQLERVANGLEPID